MSFRPEMSSQNAVDFKKALRMFRRLEALHATLSLSSRLMGVLRAIVQIPALPMSYSRQHDFFGGTIAAQFVGDDHTGSPTGGAQELAKEAHSREPVALRLDEDVNHGAVLVYRPPEIVLYTIDLQEHLVQEPFIAHPGTSPLQFGCVRRSESIAPPTDRLVAQLNASMGHH
jgi:hypothetical protein